MRCQILFAGKNKKNIISLSSAEFAHNMVSVKLWTQKCTNSDEVISTNT